MKKSTVAYQGVEGSYSSIAAQQYFKNTRAIGFPTFDEVVRAVIKGKADYALLPIENSTAGRVADLHHLLPGSGLHVVGEHFLPVHHALIVQKGAKLSEITHVYSHREALSQCQKSLRTLKLTPVPFGDTAGAVEFISGLDHRKFAALAAPAAAKQFPTTKVLKKHLEDDPENVTRFLILQKKKPKTTPKKNCITSIVYGVRDIPAALYKTLGGFATTGVNIIKLESFVPMQRHKNAHFYLEFEGNPNEKPGSLALDELKHYARDLEILGTYTKSAYRKKIETTNGV